MSYPMDCASCAIGEHDKHHASHGLTTPLIGGAVCECKGDCGDRWRMSLARIVEMMASPGDWIIRGVKGEFYPCKPGIFHATYEPATEAKP